jgi:hypothetical protein
LSAAASFSLYISPTAQLSRFTPPRIVFSSTSLFSIFHFILIHCLNISPAIALTTDE